MVLLSRKDQYDRDSLGSPSTARAECVCSLDSGLLALLNAVCIKVLQHANST